jgi:hypothetical protein
MNNRRRIVVVIGVLAATIGALSLRVRDDVEKTAAAPSRQSSRRAAAPVQRVLFGEVIDNNNVAIVGARVRAEGASIADTTTDAAGQFTLDPVPASTTALLFTAPGFADASVAAAALPTDAEAFWSQQLTRTGTEQQLVVNAAGVAVSGAVLLRVEPGRHRARMQQIGTTNVDGVVLVAADVLQQRALIGDAAHGFVAVDGRLRVELPAPATIRGRIVDSRGRPAKQASVRVLAAASDDDDLQNAARQSQIGQARVLADADGRFELLTAGVETTLQAAGAHLRPGEEQVVKLRSGVAVDVTLVLQDSSAVAGVVVDAATGAPIAGAELHPDGADGAFVAITDDKGAFVLDALPARMASLMVRKRGYRSVTVGGLEGDRSRPDSIRVEMQPGDGDEVVGIGIVAGRHPDGVRAERVNAGTPAALAGMRVGDVIVAVDGVPLDDDLQQGMARIRGAVGTTVKLVVRRRDGTETAMSIERARMIVPRRG